MGKICIVTSHTGTANSLLDVDAAQCNSRWVTREPGGGPQRVRKTIEAAPRA